MKTLRSLILVAPVALAVIPATASEISLDNGHRANEVVPVRKNGTIIDPSGGGASADQTGTNASDAQPTSTANQHALAFLYAYNGTTWDRVRATAGVISMSDATTQGILNSIKTALGSPFQAGGSISPRALTFTTTDQTLAAGGTYALATDTTIKFVKLSVKGTGAVFYSIDATAASATHGVPLNGGASATQPQGGSETFEATAVPQALSLYAIAATSVAVTVGR